MATKSILKNINVRNRRQVRELVNALEHASEWHGKDVQMSRTVSELKDKEDIRKFFETVK